MKIKLSKKDASEVMHKLSTLADEPDLQEDYDLTQTQADILLASIPSEGGGWEIPSWGVWVVKDEVKDHCFILEHQAKSAKYEGDKNEAARITRQIKRLGDLFSL